MTEKKKWRITELGALTLEELKSFVGYQESEVAPFSGKPLARVYTTNNSVEGDYLLGILEQEGIPALFQSNRDTAYDGLFLSQWGHGVIITTHEDAYRALTLIESVLQVLERTASDDGHDHEEGEED